MPLSISIIVYIELILSVYYTFHGLNVYKLQLSICQWYKPNSASVTTSTKYRQAGEQTSSYCRFPLSSGI